jgi:4,5-dihydroxyphthalate decarboxylase
VPVNHFFVVDARLAQMRPDIVRDIYRMLSESKARAGLPAGEFDYHPFGIAQNEKALSLFVQYAAEQAIIPRRIGIDELFADTAHAFK